MLILLIEWVIKMNNDNIIKYENVKNEDYKIISFNKSGNPEYFFVHDFENEQGHDYLVVGKYIGKISDLVKRGTVIQATTSVVTNLYKDDPNGLRKYNRYDAANFSDVLFTKEGYDLVTHKFLFTDGNIIRTVKIDQNDYRNTTYYGNKYSSVSTENDELFKPFSYYETKYMFRQEEHENLSFNNFMDYTYANLKKVKSIISSSELRDRVDQLTISANEIETMTILVEAIDAFNTLHNKNNSIKK